MYEINIMLDTIDKVKKFASIVTQFDGDFDILEGKYVIDAKSILGIFSVNLSKPLVLRVANEDHIDEVKAQLAEFVL